MIRPDKHPCKNPSEWRFPPGKPPERLPEYYQIACDFGTPLMLGLKDVHRNEPVYLCGTHATEIRRSKVADTGEIKSPESAPPRIGSMGLAANANSALNAPKGRQHLYILLLVGGVALAGVFFGLKLFRSTPPRSQKPAVIAGAQKSVRSATLPQKAPRKVPVAAPQKRSQAVPSSNSQPHKPSLQTANVAVKGTIAQRILPDVPKSASDTIRGTILVSVRVQVDASGNVDKTDLVVPGPSRYFARLAVEAAQRWKFNPPVVAGQNSQSEWLIRFYYTREATRADATEDDKGASAGTPPK